MSLPLLLSINATGVTDLHCLHVWSLTLGRTVVSAHIKATDPERVLASAHEICEDMGVAHSTIQVGVGVEGVVNGGEGQGLE